MNTIKLLLLLSILVLFFSCGSSKCEISDWEGSFSGLDCEGQDSLTVRIIDAGNGKINIEGELFTPDGCSVTGNVDDLDVSINLEDNTLIFNISEDGETCTLKLSK